MTGTISWHCEPTAEGWLIVCGSGTCTDGFRLARFISRDEWRTAHDQRWLFELAITQLTRATRSLMEMKG